MSTEYMTRMMTTYRRMAATVRKRFLLQCSTSQAIPLSRLGRCGKFTVCKVTGDRKACSRMGALGIFPGAEGELLCPGNGCQCILRIHGSRLCLDRTLTENILVTGL